LFYRINDFFYFKACEFSNCHSERRRSRGITSNFMKKLLLISLLGVFIFHLAKAQSIDLPPNPEPGKCYAKCQFMTKPLIKSKDLPIYTGEYPTEVVLDSLYFFTAPYYDGLVLIGKARELKFHKRKEEEEVEKMIFVKDTSLTQQYVYETIDYIIPSKKAGWTEWRTVLCKDQINTDVIIQIAKALIDKGFLNEEDLTEQLTKNLKAALSAYQKENDLPIGQLDIKTLTQLEINY